MKQGDIVILEFPFSNLSEKKIRPALVLSNNTYNKHRNVILAGVYGKATPQSEPLTNSDLTRKKLHKKSFISMQHLFSAECALLGKTIDSLTPSALKRMISSVRECF